MTTLGVVYPQFWVKNPVHVNEEFHWQLIVLKATFCPLCTVGKSTKGVHALLLAHALDLYKYIFSNWPWDTILT
jgi:hypothetical protein